MKPTIGRIVIYHTNQTDRDLFKDNFANQALELPAVIVNVWSDTCLNLKVLTDGNADLWRTSINQGNEESNWSWPEIKKEELSICSPPPNMLEGSIINEAKVSNLDPIS